MALEGAVVREEVVRTGTRFGPEDDLIELGEELGSGAAARVYVCRRLRTGEELAAKVINLQRLRLLGDFESQMSKLDREVKILRDLAHPRIVGLHSVQRTKGWVFLVMELVRGGELFDRIVQNKSLNEVEAKHVFRQLLEGVGYMHSRNVIHRDLKPENILIASSRPAEPEGAGTLLEVKIADFGLSKIISEETSWAKTFVGTPQYWAPEVLNVQGGGGSYTQAADFWSLGAVLFVMLCGRYPFDGKKMPLEEQIRTSAFNMNTAAWQKISEEAKSMVRGLLVVNPTERFNLQACLNHAWLKGAEPTPRPTTPAAAPEPSGPIVTEVSGGNVVTGVPQMVSHPSHNSDISAPSVEEAARTGSGSAEGTPKMDASPTQGVQVPSLQVGGATSAFEHETIFCLHELLKLQVSIAGSLEMAALVFRHTDVELADAIRKTFWQARDLSARAVNVVSQYAQVAQQVSTMVLPDLELAIQEKEPNLAVSLLGMVKDWVANMKQDGQEIQRLYHGLQESVHSLIQRAQHTKADADRRLAEAVVPEAAAMLPPSPRSQQLLALGPPTDHTEAVACGGRPAYHPLPRSPGPSTNVAASAKGNSAARAGSGPGTAVSFGPATLTSPGGHATNAVAAPSMNVWTRQLFEQLTGVKGGGAKAIQDKYDADLPRNGNAAVGTPSPGADTGGQFTNLDSEAWKRDVLELLFMAPGVVPTQLPKVESFGNYGQEATPPCTGSDCTAEDVPMSDNGETLSDTNRATAGDDALVPFVQGLAPPSAAEAMHSSASLVRALRELKRVDEILEGCSAFWANMDGTVQKLAQLKEHTERLVNFAANSKPLRERFEQRLGEYRSFWSSLERLCRQYCLDHQASAKRMYEVIREVSDISDVVDTAHSARLGVLSVMGTKRRHGY